MTDSEYPRVLIIDDEPDMRELIGDALRHEGLHIEAAGSAAEACAAARRMRPDVVVTDLHLPDCRGTEIIDQIREAVGDVPTVIITGKGNLEDASEACRQGCVDFLIKPLNIERLREAVRREISRRDEPKQRTPRELKLRRLARELNRDRHSVRHRLDTTCAALTRAYRSLNDQFLRQESVLTFHRQLLLCREDDDVFRSLFHLYAEHRGNLFGVAMVCDENAELQMIGRFGTPGPDSVSICQGYGFSLLDAVLQDPAVLRIDPTVHPALFPNWLEPHLHGISFLCVPLIPAEGQLIGLVVLYRKEGETFTDDDVALSEMLAPSVAMSIQGNTYDADDSNAA